MVRWNGHHLAFSLQNSFSEVQAPVVPWPSAGSDIFSSTSFQLMLCVASVSRKSSNFGCRYSAISIFLLSNCERGWSAILLPSLGEKLLLLSGGGRYPPGRAGGWVGEHAPQMLLYWLHEGSQLPVLTAFWHLGGHFGGGGVVLGTHCPQILLYVLQLLSQLPLLIASLHFDGHCGGGEVVLGTHCPHILLYELQFGSQLPV